MGNQLTVAPSVDLANISSDLELIAPLGVEGRGYFSSFHCYYYCDYDERDDDDTNGAVVKDRRDNDELNTSASVPRPTIRAAGRPPLARQQVRRRPPPLTSQEESETNRLTAATAALCSSRKEWHNWRWWLRTSPAAWHHFHFNDSTPEAWRRDLHSHGYAGSSGGHRASSGDAAAGLRRPAAGSGDDTVVSDTFAFSEEWSSHYENYAQLLLRRSSRRSTGSVAAGPGHGSSSFYSSTATRPPNGSYPAKRFPTPASHAGGGSSSSAVRDGRCRADVVSKIFVCSPDDAGQLYFLHRAHRHLDGMGDQLAVVDTTLPLSQGIRSCLWYDFIHEGEGFCVLQRPYIAFALPERLMTRPHLSSRERLYLVYQLLRAVMHLHDTYGVVHGDLKPNNVLLQSTGFLVLTDMAPFKPGRLPIDNPVLFNYYYDTDESRACYVAPEKFTDQPLPVPPSEAKARSNATYNVLNLNLLDHTPSMDIFSAACVILYIYMEEAPLRLSEVLELRHLDTQEDRVAFLEPLLQDCGAPAVLRPMLLEMLATLPGSRPSAQHLLETSTEQLVFPRSFGYLYDDVLPGLLSQSADAQLLHLYGQIGPILERCSAVDAADEAGDSFTCGTNDTIATAGHGNELKENPVPSLRGGEAVLQHRSKADAALIILPILLQAMEVATSDEATFRGIRCIEYCLPLFSLPTLSSVLLPHLVYLVSDDAHEYAALVRVLALRLIGVIVERIARYLTSREAQVQSDGEAASPEHSALLIEEWTVMEDLVFPCLGDLLMRSTVESVAVLVELAVQLPQLLLVSRYLTEHRQLFYQSLDTQTSSTEHGTGLDRASSASSPLLDEGSSCTSDGGGHVEWKQRDALPQLRNLLANGWLMLQILYNHPNISVTTAMVRQTPRVVLFLGDARSSEDLVPLLTTLLNAPLRVQRVLYPQSILLHALLHSPQMKTLRFFVSEGLRRTDTACLKSTMDSVALVVRRKSMPVEECMELVHQTLPLLTDGRWWIQRTACEVVEAAAQTYSASTLMVYLDDAIRPLLTHQVPLVALSRYTTAIRSDMTSSLSFSDWRQGVAPAGSDGSSGGAIPGHLSMRHAAAGAQLGATAAKCERLPLLPSSFPWHRLPPHQHQPHPDVAACGDPEDSPALSDALPPRERDRVLQECQVRLCCPLCSSENLTTPSRTVATGSSDSAMAVPAPTPSLAPQVPTDTQPSPYPHSLPPPSSVVGVAPAPSAPSSRLESSQLRGPLSSNARAALVPFLRPVAIPRSSCQAHVGPIYTIVPHPQDLVLSAGGRGEAVLWRVEAPSSSAAPALQLAERAPVANIHHSFLTSQLMQGRWDDSRGGGGHLNIVALGSTDGSVRLLDILTNKWVRSCFIGGAGLAEDSGSGSITAMALQDHDTLLLTTADGGLHVVDCRCGGTDASVWRTQLDPLDGVPSSLCPLYAGDQACAVVVGTYGGTACLFDLRYGLQVQRSVLSSQSIPTNPEGQLPITAICVDPLSSLAHKHGSAADEAATPYLPDAAKEPSVLLSTAAGPVYRLFLQSGSYSPAFVPRRIEGTFPDAQSASFGAAAVRSLLALPKHGIVWTGSEDGFIRSWSTAHPEDSCTLSCPPFASPLYTQRLRSGGGSSPPRGGRGSSAVRYDASIYDGDDGSPTGGPSAATPSYHAIVEQPPDTLRFGPTPPRHHADAVLALSAIRTATPTACGGGQAEQFSLLSGSRDGTLIMWDHQPQ